MGQRETIVMGGSAGSIRTLEAVVGDLPGDLAAAIFVVVHLRARERSLLAEIFNRAGSLPAMEAADGQRIQHGAVYVAPPDRHMLIAEGHIHLSRGPKEGLHRPSINVTFRSAAAAYGERVIGVLLSGMLDDGAAGLWEIVQHHGLAMIQDPEEAEFPSMPKNALADVPINYKLRSGEMGRQLAQLVRSPDRRQAADKMIVNEVSPARFSGFTCPECRGPLYEHRTRPPEFKCRVGHIFPLETLIDEGTSTQERKMYEAIVSLEEGADMAEYAAAQPGSHDREQLLEEAKQLCEHAKAIRQLIEERRSPPLSR